MTLLLRPGDSLETNKSNYYFVFYKMATRYELDLNTSDVCKPYNTVVFSIAIGPIVLTDRVTQAARATTRLTYNTVPTLVPHGPCTNGSPL